MLFPASELGSTPRMLDLSCASLPKNLRAARALYLVARARVRAARDMADASRSG